MSGAEQRTAGASWDDPIELDVSSPVRGERAKSDQDTSNHGDDSGTGSHLDDAIDVDALVEEPTVEGEWVRHFEACVARANS